MDEQYYSFWESPYNSDRALSPRAALQDTIASLRRLTNPTAKVSTHKVTLNGESVKLGAYTINGSNYFKLRDLGDALGFGVDWNADTMTMILTVK